MPILAGYAVPHPPIIIPEVGGGEEKKIARTMEAYRQAAREIRELKPDTIILTTPHLTLYQDYFHIAPGKSGQGDFSHFGAPEVRLDADYDQELILDLSLALASDSFPAGTEGAQEQAMDHATTVPLYFIQEEYRDFRLVRIGLSGLGLNDHYRLGRYIREAVDRLDRRAVFVASGDLSHCLKADGPYGFHPQGPVYDDRIMDILSRAAFDELLAMDPKIYEPAGECGHRSFAIMAGSFDRTSVKARALSYEGPFGVGYGVVSFRPTGPDPGRDFLDRRLSDDRKENEALRHSAGPHVRLALAVIEANLTDRAFDLEEYGAAAPLPPEMLDTRAGVFVTLHREGALRGCIGTISPTTESVAEEIRRNAIEAAFHDPRFPPLAIEEFPLLTVSVDVLQEPEAIASEDLLDPKVYGVIVSSGRRRGLLLPDLEGIDTAKEQVQIARSKAGIAPGEPVRLERFRVVRHL